MKQSATQEAQTSSLENLLFDRSIFDARPDYI
jgi:hypothetical protein